MMLEHLRQRAAQALAAETEITLTSNGPAGLQVDRFPCRSTGLRLFILVPRASDQLINLEEGCEAAGITSSWKINGICRKVEISESLADLQPSTWGDWVELLPVRLHLTRPPYETIDF